MGQIVLTQQATPNTPPAGSLALYADSNNNLKYMTSTGSIGGITNGRNRIVNGAMEINQRQKTGTLVSGDVMVDRFRTSLSASSTVTFTQSTDVPTNAQAGQSFQNSLNVQATTEASLDASDIISFYQGLEGYNIKDLIGDGYNNGFTISFWAKCTVAGTYCLWIQESTAGRCYVHECAITTAWTKITHTVTAVPSGGTWLKTNGLGLTIGITLMSGSNRKDGTNDTWVSTSDERATANQTFANNGVTVNWYFTGFQLEAGPVATPFEFRLYAQELNLCRRYCRVYLPGLPSAKAALRHIGNYIELMDTFEIPMRATPTFFHNITGWSSGSATTTLASAYDYANTRYYTITGALSINGVGVSNSAGYLDFIAASSFDGTKGDAAVIQLGPDVICGWSIEL